MIDPVFKEQLMSALHQAVEHFNTGMPPSDAVVKAARDNEFNVEQANRLVESFNTARTLSQYAAGEKSATVSLANKDEVACKLLEAAPIKAASVEPDFSEYDKPETLAHDGMIVTAEDMAMPVPQAKDIELTDSSKAYRFNKAISTQRSMAKYSEDMARQVEGRVEFLFNKLATWFREMGHDDSMDKLARFNAIYNDRVEYTPLMRNLYDFITPAQRKELTREKVAAFGQVVEDRDLGPAKACIVEIQKLAQQAVELRSVAAVMTKDADEAEQKFDAQWAYKLNVVQVKDALAPFFKAAAPPMSPMAMMTAAPTQAANSGKSGGKKEDKKPDAPKPSSSSPGVVSRLTDNATDSMGKSLGGYVTKGLHSAISRPRIEGNAKMTDRLKNLQRQMVLQDLYINDPVISEAEPQQIQSAFAAVHQLAPEVTTNKEVMRAILRHAIHTVAISPYDASSWGELEKLIQSVRGTTPPVQKFKEVER